MGRYRIVAFTIYIVEGTRDLLGHVSEGRITAGASFERSDVVNNSVGGGEGGTPGSPRMRRPSADGVTAPAAGLETSIAGQPAAP